MPEDKKLYYKIVLIKIEDHKAYLEFCERLKSALNVPSVDLKNYLIPGKAILSFRHKKKAIKAMKSLSFSGVQLELIEEQLEQKPEQTPFFENRIKNNKLNKSYMLMISVGLVMIALIVTFAYKHEIKKALVDGDKTPTFKAIFKDKAISSSGGHTCGLSLNERGPPYRGSLKCWGANEYGQLGNGTTDDSPIQVDVTGLTQGVKAIATGPWNSCAILSNDSVKCWGLNKYGQLGDGTTTTRLTPVDSRGLESGIVAIAIGLGHICALTSDGDVKCRGANKYGQLGNGSTSESEQALQDVSDLDGDITAIVAGDAHTCALTTFGGVKCWGADFAGQLGNAQICDARGKDQDRCCTTPFSVWGLDNSGIKAISASGANTCALTYDGGVKCWGLNNYGQLGDGTTEEYSATPEDVDGLDSDVLAISIAGDHACALINKPHKETYIDEKGNSTSKVVYSGQVNCWGADNYYQLAMGGVDQRETCGHFNIPCSTTPIDSHQVDIKMITTGNVIGVEPQGYTCALNNRGSVRCWGYNEQGQFGNGTTLTNKNELNIVTEPYTETESYEDYPYEYEDDIDEEPVKAPADELNDAQKSELKRRIKRRNALLPLDCMTGPKANSCWRLCGDEDRRPIRYFTDSGYNFYQCLCDCLYTVGCEGFGMYKIRCK